MYGVRYVSILWKSKGGFETMKGFQLKSCMFFVLLMSMFFEVIIKIKFS